MRFYPVVNFGIALSRRAKLAYGQYQNLLPDFT